MTITALEQMAYGFRPTGQKAENILQQRACSEPECFVEFKGYKLLKEQYAALEKLCAQFELSPGEMFQANNSFEAENCLATKIITVRHSIKTWDEVLVIPAAFRGLREINCYSNGLKGLIIPYELPLQAIICESNHLTALPALPITLQYLSCGNNLLTALPELPPRLQRFMCRENKLTALPDLPSALQELDVFRNELTFLPGLPPTLQKLDCGINSLVTMPELPLSLHTLCCNWNYSLKLPELPLTIQHIDCDFKALSPEQYKILEKRKTSMTIRWYKDGTD